MDPIESIVEKHRNNAIRLSRSVRDTLLSVLPTIPILLVVFYLSDVAVSIGGALFLIWYYVSISALIAFFVQMYSKVNEQLSEFWEESFPDRDAQSRSLLERIQIINERYKQPPSKPQHISEEETDPILPHLVYSVRQLFDSLLWFLFFASIYAISALLGGNKSLSESLFQGDNLAVLVNTVGSAFPPAALILETGLIPGDTSVAVSVFFLIGISAVISITAITNLFKASENFHRLVFIKLTSRSEYLLKYEPVLYLPLTIGYIFTIQSLA